MKKITHLFKVLNLSPENPEFYSTFEPSGKEKKIVNHRQFGPIHRWEREPLSSIWKSEIFEAHRINKDGKLLSWAKNRDEISEQIAKNARKVHQKQFNDKP